MTNGGHKDDKRTRRDDKRMRRDDERMCRDDKQRHQDDKPTHQDGKRTPRLVLPSKAPPAVIISFMKPFRFHKLTWKSNTRFRRPLWIYSILAVLASTLLWGCEGVNAVSPVPSAPTANPASNPTALPTATAVSTLSPDPSPTPFAPQEPDPGAERAAALQDSLYRASLEYVAETTAEANAVVKSIKFNRGAYENVKNACGPLSIAIMRSGGILPDTTSVREIWLLCAREGGNCNGMTVLKREYFPPSEYDYFQSAQSVREYDFAANPLQAGDWLYLYVKHNGFDHMLVVTRVDANGAAYTVTNLNRGEGFKITEELLYDPAKPGTGLFYELTDPIRLKYELYLGLSGDGGFMIIRRKGGLAAVPEFNQALDAVLAEGTVWNGIIREAGSSAPVYESNPYSLFHPASMIKIPLAMLVLHGLERQGSSPADLQKLSFGTKTLDRLLTDMVVYSDEDAAAALLIYADNLKLGAATLREWGLPDTSLNPRQTTAVDLAHALEGLYSGELLGKPMRDYLLSLMAVRTENDSFYLGPLSQMLPGALFYNKRGTSAAPPIVGDMGILEYQGKTWIIVLSGRPDELVGSSYSALENSISEFAQVLAELLR